MTCIVEIEHQAKGKSDSSCTDPILVELKLDTITLREFIGRCVIEEMRIRGATPLAEESMILTQAEIEQQHAGGKIGKKTMMSSEKCISNACNAFERGKFLVFVAGRQVHDLNEQLKFGEQTRVVFLRLTPLIGG